MEIINITENKYFSKYHLDKIFREVKKSELKEQPSFRMMEGVAKYMDGYFLDPIIGFFVPGVGDSHNGCLGSPICLFLSYPSQVDTIDARRAFQHPR